MKQREVDSLFDVSLRQSHSPVQIKYINDRFIESLRRKVLPRDEFLPNVLRAATGERPDQRRCDDIEELLIKMTNNTRRLINI